MFTNSTRQTRARGASICGRLMEYMDRPVVTSPFQPAACSHVTWAQSTDHAAMSPFLWGSARCGNKGLKSQ